MADEVQFTDEQWERVAQAAEVFVGVLAEEQVNLRGLLQSNWAGECAEGEATIENLRLLLAGKSGSFSQALESEANYLINVASNCRAAKTALTSADQSESTKFRQ